jgi:hypothetical protein
VARDRTWDLPLIRPFTETGIILPFCDNYSTTQQIIFNHSTDYLDQGIKASSGGNLHMKNITILLAVLHFSQQRSP